VERVLDDISFDASDRGRNAVVVDGAYVHARVGDLARNADLSKFIL
jgi:ATP-dependent HslUV protease ATP-binding subunit HslU